MNADDNSLLLMAQEAAAISFAQRSQHQEARGKFAEACAGIRQRWMGLERDLQECELRNGQLEVELHDQKQINHAQLIRHAADIATIRRETSEQLIAFAEDAKQEIADVRQEVEDVQVVAKQSIHEMRRQMQAEIDRLSRENAGLRADLDRVTAQRDQAVNVATILLNATQESNRVVHEESAAMIRVFDEVIDFTSKAPPAAAPVDQASSLPDAFMANIGEALSSAEVVLFPDHLDTARAA